MRRFAPVLVLALALPGCGSSKHHDRAVRLAHGDGISYAIPAGWHAAPRSLTPHLLNPKELLTVGTGSLPRGGRCNHMPAAALAALGPADVLLTVQERYGAVGSFPARQAHFTLPPAAPTEAQTCAGPHVTFATHWFEFGDNGRGFHVLVAVGRSAPKARVQDAVAVLDSLRIARRRPARIDPDAAIPYDDPSRGLAIVMPNRWRVYTQRLTQVISARDQLALGTFPLRRRKPDPDCAPTTALRARPHSGGFIYMFEERGLNPTQLARFPARPSRFSLPRSSHLPYECFGLSWKVRFREAGRAFQAHVYGPASARRQALEILDSLRVSPAP